MEWNYSKTGEYELQTVTINGTEYDMLIENKGMTYNLIFSKTQYLSTLSVVGCVITNIPDVPMALKIADVCMKFFSLADTSLCTVEMPYITMATFIKKCTEWKNEMDTIHKALEVGQEEVDTTDMDVADLLIGEDTLEVWDTQYDDNHNPTMCTCKLKTVTEPIEKDDDWYEVNNLYKGYDEYDDDKDNDDDDDAPNWVSNFDDDGYGTYTLGDYTITVVEMYAPDYMDIEVTWKDDYDNEVSAYFDNFDEAKKQVEERVLGTRKIFQPSLEMDMDDIASIYGSDIRNEPDYYITENDDSLVFHDGCDGIEYHISSANIVDSCVAAPNHTSVVTGATLSIESTDDDHTANIIPYSVFKEFQDRYRARKGVN